MNLWFTEHHTPNVHISYRILRTLHQEQTAFQNLAVVESAELGRMLILDDIVQTTVRDEFIYHEMITHVGLFTHPHPQRVLVIGGGDGGSVRETLKHPTVEQVDLVEIDPRVIEAAKKYLPEISCQLEHPKVRIINQDGTRFVKEHQGEYDMIIIDSPDPIGPASALFGGQFYQDVYQSLKEDGLFVAQTESPFYNQEVVRRVFRDAKGVFPVVRLFLAGIPTYQSGIWCFTLGSKLYDPLKVDKDQIPPLEAKYYTPEIHSAAFALPAYIQKLLD